MNNRLIGYDVTCFNYIHQNPKKAKLELEMGNWQFSSFRDYIGKRKGTLCNQEMARELLHLPTDKQEFWDFSHKNLDDELLGGIF